MKETFRASMAWLHTALGLTTGWVLYAIALSGALSVFRQAINLWARPELGAASVDAVQADSLAIAWLNRHAASSGAWYLGSATADAPFASAIWSDPHGRFLQRVFDPSSSSPEGIRDTLGGEFFYRFHFELQLPYPWGRLIAAVAALAMVAGLITGIVIHRRMFADFFTFRMRRGQRSWLDAHNLLGVAALPFHLMISFTGAVMLGSLLLPWSTQAIYRHDIASSFTDLNPALYSRPVLGQPGRLAPMAPLLRESERRFEGAGIAQIYVTNPADRASVVAVIAGNDGVVSTAVRTLIFDGPTGRLISEHVEKRPVIGAYALLYGLHVARFAPCLARWLYFLSGLMLAGVIGSGMHLWVIKRLRRQSHLGHRIAGRLNTGVLAGAPLGFATFFLANRILPSMMAGRARYEVQSVFIVWAMAIVFAFLRRPARAWPELWGCNALACMTIALLGAPWHKPVAIGVSLTALVLAGAFGYAAGRSAARKVFAI
ncbi:membrane protein [Neoasaia chiangmaiensis]|nr:PepSY-associated TM helix domain-containing protein [Neoasaia chiangmaiensis]GEN14749.1 membrane protein [Neoasaia chiangmaiensis]